MNPGTATAGPAATHGAGAEAQSLHGLIELQAGRTPQAEALRCNGESLSYAELDARANRCAHYLRELGVGPDTIVGVFMERSVEMVVALLAVLKAGGAYLPLDTGYPAARLQFVLDDANVPVVLTQQRHAARLEAFAGTVLALDARAGYLERYPADAPQHFTRPRDLAYVIYTSGSTGQPKGCLLPHGAICNRLLWMQDEYRLRPGDRVLQKTPYTFDVSVWEFFWPLLSGATLVLAAPQGHKDSHYLVGLIRAEGITVCHFVPSMLRFFLNDADAAGCTSLRDVFVSGEALPYDLVLRFRQTMGARLHNLYGPTEAAVDVSYWACELRPDRKVPIGRAIRNLRLYVLDAQRRPVERGAEGELYIAGVGLARGYLRRPELTAERFVDDPFHPGEKMYRTGDRAVELDDGNIEFLGRIDFQVKLRGLRIELGEIESVLRSLDGVREAAVLVRGEEEGDPKLVAYLETTTGNVLDARQVRRQAAAQLPEYMVPSLVVTMAQLPVTVHGKLDRGALPWPVQPGALLPAAVAAVAPAPVRLPAQEPAQEPAQDPAQGAAAVLARIGAIVSGVLRHDGLADDADLFDLGATSLSLVRIVEQIRGELGAAVPLDVFLDAPTVGSIAAYVASRGGVAPAAAPAAAAVPAGAEPPRASAAAPDGGLALRPVAYQPRARVADGAQAGFSGAAVSFEAFSAWLGLLMAGRGEGDPKYRYPSGGGLNPVRTYVYVRDGGVAGLPGGACYYHPEAHTLYRVGSSAALAGADFGADAPRFGQAAFAVFFVAEMDAVEPLYQEASPTLVTLDAGYMSQLLLGAQDGCGLAAAPATQVDVDRLVPVLGLGGTERFVHALLVGVPAGAAVAAGGGRPGSAFAAARCVQHEVPDAVFASQGGISVSYKQLREERRHLRRVEAGGQAWPLARVDFCWPEHALRASCREYGPQPAGVDQLAGLLGMLRPQADTGPRRYLYGAVGTSRELVVYAYLRGGDVAEGLYHYDPAGHRLRAVAPLSAAQVEQVYTPYNRKHFKAGSFVLFVFGRGASGAARQAALHAGLLDAGHLGQLWMERQAELGLGLCPIGAIRFERIRDAFDLAPGLELLHSFIGGVSAREVPASRQRIEIGPMAAAAPVPAAPGGDGAGVAIIGMSGRYPGADDLEGFWRNLSAGVCSIGPLPPGRRADAGGADAPAGGYLDDIASFDSLLFGITPVEARCLDPQERLLLEGVWASLEDAGYTAQALTASCRRVGVFVGAMWNDYQSIGVERWRAHGRAEESSHHASLANRISYVFDFAGPSVAVNTSCSSGLTALHMACESIRRGECDAAIVGGVNLLAHPYHAQLLSDLGLLSRDGGARPLSAQANGWAPGEGVGAVVLKSLRRAQHDGDHVHALIHASGMGHSGRAPRYGAPSVRRQAEHLGQLLASAALAPADIDYIEAAAPGASLADAAELSAVSEVFGTARRDTPCRVGTVKGHIGHLESASGLSQLAKVVLQLRHGMLVPALHAEPLNPLITLPEQALAVVTQPTPWAPRLDAGMRRPRYALINAIGAAGSSAHVIVAEYLPPPRQPQAQGPEVVLLSAATEALLHQQVQRLHAFLSGQAQDCLADLAHTLRVGRVALQERLAVVADSADTLRERLRAVLAGATPAGVHRGTVEDGRRGAARAGGEDLDRLAAAWAQGLDVDWRALERPGQRRMPLPTYPFERVRHWLDGAPATPAVPAAAPATSAVAAEPTPQQARQLALLQEQTHAFLVRELAQATGIPATRIGIDRPLESLGLTSLIIQTLNAGLGRAFPDLPKTVLFEHRSLRSLAAYLMQAQRPALQALLGIAELPAASAVPPAPRGAAATAGPAQLPPRAVDDIAIVGLAGRYPQAETLDDFWRNLAEGRDCIEEIPGERWDYGRYALSDPNAKCSRWGGFLRDADAFDPLFFGISPAEAERMDPQERLMLQAAWHAFEDAGYSRTAIQESLRDSVGVFIGVMYGEYQLYPSLEHGLSLSGSYATIANRVSYVLNLRGPSMAVDTMCSSSLTALHLACESIRRGDCAAAIAGGVNLSLHPNKYATHAMLNMPSSDGRCHSFGAGGDGFVPAEGVGAVLLKPLAQALADGDHVYGVVKASVINHGGKTNGYTVPNPDAQQELVAAALRRAGIHARAVSYVEAHGTGTALGDPIEIAGLSRAFGEHTSERQFCAIGSVKSNIGHAESAAGIAGLTKVLLQMRHGELVPSLHAREPNPNIDFARTPFVVQQERAPWRRPVVEVDGAARELPRIAGISSFGAGGSNAHVIVVEHRPAEPRAPYTRLAGQPLLVPLSAKNPQRLLEQVRQLLAALERGAVTEHNLADAAYTLQVGREAMEHRLALAVLDRDDLAAKLAAVLAGEADIDGVYRDQARRHRGDLSMLVADEDMASTIEAWMRKGKFAKLLELWVRGVAFDWKALYGERLPRRMSLPTYPFARERFWATPPAAVAAPAGGVPAAVARAQRRGFDRAFFEKLFEDVERDALSVEGALAAARKRT